MCMPVTQHHRYVPVTDLQASRYPEDNHADVDDGDKYCCIDHDFAREVAVCHNDLNAIDDDL